MIIAGNADFIGFNELLDKKNKKRSAVFTIQILEGFTLQ